MSNASAAALASLIGSLAVLAFILYRQRQVRVVSTKLTFPAVLALLGLGSLSGAGEAHPLSATDLAVLAILLAGDAVGLGAVRAYSVRLWRAGESVLRQGTWLTLGLWVVGAAMHAAVDGLDHLGSGSLLLYLGVTYGAQRLVLRRRVAELERRTGAHDDTGHGLWPHRGR